MNILITGGTGLIGRPLIRSLLSNGHLVTVLSRNTKKISASPALQVLDWDGRTVTGWGHQLNLIDAVINLAGENIGRFPWTEKRKRTFRESRLDAGNVLVEAIQKAESRPRMFIQASAVGYYGPHGNELVDESTAPGGDFSARLCIDWEASTEPVELMGLRRIVIRTGVVLAKGGGVLPLMAFPVQLFVGGRLGRGEQGYPWIHIDDEVNAIKYLLENENSQGVYNLSAPNPMSNADFTQSLARILHRPYWFHAPQFVIRLALGEMSTLLLDGQYMLPKRLVEGGFRFEYETVESALRDLYSG
jgi:uncharacterized protein